MEFLAQIGALVGTSAVLYFVTQPPPKNDLLQQITGSKTNDTTTNTTSSSSSTTSNINPPAVLPLRGIQRYSSYHRIRYHNMISRSSSNISSGGSTGIGEHNSVSSNSSTGSNHYNTTTGSNNNSGNTPQKQA
jgi:hypothetical protein